MANAQFHALNGLEVKELLLKSISAALDQSGEFPQHITFPFIVAKFRLDMKVLPRDAANSDPKTVVDKEIRSVDPELKDHSGARTVVISSDSTIDVPDQARQDAGLPIPTRVRGLDGTIEDGLVHSKVPPVDQPLNVVIERPSLAGDTPTEFVDEVLKSVVQPEHPPEPVRSVEVKTRAAGKGAAVAGKHRGTTRSDESTDN